MAKKFPVLLWALASFGALAFVGSAGGQMVTPLIIPPAAPKAASAPSASGAGAKATFTSAQAQRGHEIYARNCADCHGANLNDGEFGGAALNGSEFREKFFGNTVDVLFGYMSTAMPPDRPGQLPAQQYADLTAFIMSQNAIQPGAAEVPSDIDKMSGLTLQP